MWNALFLLAQLYSQIDENEMALRYLQEAVEWVQGAEYYLSVAAHNLARGYVAVGHIAAAFDNLERAIQLCPNEKESIREARRLRVHAQSWIGTSGTLTPFEKRLPTGDGLVEDDEAFDVCGYCGQSNPMHVCAGCGMTGWYATPSCTLENGAPTHLHFRVRGSSRRPKGVSSNERNRRAKDNNCANSELMIKKLK